MCKILLEQPVELEAHTEGKAEGEKNRQAEGADIALDILAHTDLN